MLDTMLRLIAPHSCCGCGYLGSILCHQCKDDIVSEPFSQCVVCLKPTAGANLCTSRCLLPAEAVWCVGQRSGPLKSLLDRYKFDAAREASSVLISLLDNSLPLLPTQTVVVAVPTASSHRRARGFDHMGRVARGFARHRRLAYGTPLSRNGGETQHFKTKRERETAAERDIQLSGQAVSPAVLLLDDIYTTGATIRRSVKLLRSAGATELYVGLIARQPLDETDHL